MQQDHVYRKTELVGSSATSLSDAIETAIARASKTLRNVEWFEVSEIRGQVQDGKVGHYQVVLKVGFRVEEG
jgi:flavin-binding protein dodecin